MNVGPDNINPDIGGVICRSSARDLTIAIGEYGKEYGLVPVNHRHVHVDGMNSRDDWSALLVPSTLLVPSANILPVLQKLVELLANTNPPAQS